MMFYFVAVCVAAWAGGVRAAMVTALFSSVLANYLFSEPRGTSANQQRRAVVQFDRL